MRRQRPHCSTGYGASGPFRAGLAERGLHYIVGVTELAEALRRVVEASVPLDGASEAQFVKPEHRAMLVVDDDPDRLIERFEAYRPPHVAKWIGLAQT